MKIIHMVQGSQEWLSFRRSRIGASDASAILGLSPYSTAYELWRDKVFSEEKVMTSNMAYGKKNEGAAREMFEQMSEHLVLGDKMAQHDTRSWQIASLDGIDLDETMFVEIKCANALDHAMAKDGQVPPKYMPQIQHQFSVTGLDLGFYFSFNKGEGIIVQCQRDEKYIEKLVEAEMYFYHVNMTHKYPPDMSEKDIKKHDKIIKEYLDERTA